MIKVLCNPMTGAYLQLKSTVFSDSFPWYWNKKSTPPLEETNGAVNIPFYSHVFLARPETSPFATIESMSSATKLASQVMFEILSANRITVNAFLRISANCVEPTKEVLSTIEHEDHTFPHTNILVHLNKTDAGTVVEGEVNTPSEDQAILFSGPHYHTTPTTSRRLVLVATFI